MEGYENFDSVFIILTRMVVLVSFNCLVHEEVVVQEHGEVVIVIVWTNLFDGKILGDEPPVHSTRAPKPRSVIVNDFVDLIEVGKHVVDTSIKITSVVQVLSVVPVSLQTVFL